MKLKQMVAVALFVFVGLSIAYMLVKEGDTSTVTEEPSTSADRAKAQLVVYYFHGDVRCATCHKLETYAKEALEANFGDKLASRDIVWRTVNVDRSDNGHYVGDYGLVSKAVVLSWVADGKEVRWKKLDKIWQKVNDKESYLEYVRQSVEGFLEEGA